VIVNNADKPDIGLRFLMEQADKSIFRTIPYGTIPYHAGQYFTKRISKCFGAFSYERFST